MKTVLILALYSEPKLLLTSKALRAFNIYMYVYVWDGWKAEAAVPETEMERYGSKYRVWTVDKQKKVKDWLWFNTLWFNGNAIHYESHWAFLDIRIYTRGWWYVELPSVTWTLLRIVYFLLITFICSSALKAR